MAIPRTLLGADDPGRPALPQNRLLASLPESERRSLLASCSMRRVEAAEVLVEPGQTMAQIYFPLDTLVSLLAVAEGRMTLEVMLVGQEGMVGASAALNARPAQCRAVVQRAGRLACLDAQQFRRAVACMPALQRLVQRYTDILLAQALQIAMCSRFHILEARLARSLLITRERLQLEKFHLTHEFLGQILGVRRVGVTKAATALQHQQLISYSRGNIQMLDTAGLAAVACSCYPLVKEDGALGIGQVFH